LIDLLPCPFCGSEAAGPEYEVNIYWVSCKKCTATALADVWNKRSSSEDSAAYHAMMHALTFFVEDTERAAPPQHGPYEKGEYVALDKAKEALALTT
jgi:hypothetical protein